MHPSYKFEITPILVAEMGNFPKCLVTYLKMVEFEGKEMKLLISRMEVKYISGSVKNLPKIFQVFMILISESEGIFSVMPNIYDS